MRQYNEGLAAFAHDGSRLAGLIVVARPARRPLQGLDVAQMQRIWARLACAMSESGPASVRVARTQRPQSVRWTLVPMCPAVTSMKEPSQPFLMVIVSPTSTLADGIGSFCSQT
jgi:hypothetical protein